MHKPSKILSEGEQKVLALADLIAEARLAGIRAPVFFDDPASRLDHLRINEVARRIASRLVPSPDESSRAAATPRRTLVGQRAR